MSAKWYVIRTISGQEKKVKQYLESEIARLSLADYILQILIPTEKIFVVRNNKKKVSERSYMPGYVFLEFQIDDSNKGLNSEVIQVIKDVPGVVGFLGSEKGKTPIPMRQSEINKIIGKADELKEMDEVMENPYHVGENVKVMDGAFNGFTGIVEEVYDEKKKLKVMVKIFGRNIPLELNYLQVERL